VSGVEKTPPPEPIKCHTFVPEETSYATTWPILVPATSRVAPPETETSVGDVAKRLGGKTETSEAVHSSFASRASVSEKRRLEMRQNHSRKDI
jgi:hypothetical protein